MAALTRALPSTVEQGGELGCFEPELYLNSNSNGYFAIWRIDKAAAAKRREVALAAGTPPGIVNKWGNGVQEMHPLRDLSDVIRKYQGQKDVFISQALFRGPYTSKKGTFYKANRKATNAISLGLAFVDLDMVVLPRDINSKISEILSHCVASGIPEPSYILHSGRGLHVKWVFNNPIPRPAILLRWKLMMQHLNPKFEPFGVDKGAKDISRVLRLPGSINGKSGLACEVKWVNRIDGNIVRHDFDKFADAVLPMTRQDYRAEQQRQYDARGAEWEQQRLEKKRKLEDNARLWAEKKAGLSVVRSNPSKQAKPSNGIYGNPRQLALHRAEDLFKLAKARSAIADGISADRESITYWWLNFRALAGLLRSSDVVSAAQDFAVQMWPVGWVQRHEARWESQLASLVERVQKWENGDRDALCTPGNPKLIENLNITPEEQQTLQTIFSSEEKKRRRTAKRRASGQIDRETYLSQNSASRMQPWKALGISRSTYYQRKKNQP